MRNELIIMKDNIEKFIETGVAGCLFAAAIVAFLLMIMHALWKPLKKTTVSLLFLLIMLAGAGCKTTQPDESSPSSNHLLIIGGNVMEFPNQIE